MAGHHRIQASLTSARPLRQEGATGIALEFEPLHSRTITETIEDFADLSADEEIASVSGVSKVMRILRIARIAAPREPDAYLERPEEVAAMLARAVGVELRLELRPRSRIHFNAWTENGVETVHDIKEVIELEDGYLAIPHASQMATYFSRDDVVRQQTEVEHWYEVVSIERC